MQGLPANLPNSIPPQMPTPGQAPQLPESFSLNPVGAEIGLWPLAWGWWLLLLVTVCAVVSLFFWVRHYRRKRAFLRMAIKEVQTLNASEPDLKASCNQILKRTFMSYFPVEVIASLHGKNWSEFLTKQLSDKHKMVMTPFLTRLSDGFYQSKSYSEVNITDQEFVASTLKLLKQTLPPSKKQLELFSTETTGGKQ